MAVRLWIAHTEPVPALQEAEKWWADLGFPISCKWYDVSSHSLLLYATHCPDHCVLGMAEIIQISANEWVSIFEKITLAASAENLWR